MSLLKDIILSPYRAGASVGDSLKITPRNGRVKKVLKKSIAKVAAPAAAAIFAVGAVNLALIVAPTLHLFPIGVAVEGVGAVAPFVFPVAVWPIVDVFLGGFTAVFLAGVSKGNKMVSRGRPTQIPTPTTVVPTITAPATRRSSSITAPVAARHYFPSAQPSEIKKQAAITTPAEENPSISGRRPAEESPSISGRPQAEEKPSISGRPPLSKIGEQAAITTLKASSKSRFLFRKKGIPTKTPKQHSM